MKKFFGLLLIAVLFVVGPTPKYIPAATSGIYIHSYTAEIELTPTGDMIVHEEWEMEYNSTYRVRFRDIDFQKFPDEYPLPYSTVNEASFDTSEYDVQIYKNGRNVTSNVTIGTSFNYDRDELGYYVTCEPPSAHCESLFIDTINAGRLNGDIRFVYDYRINGAVTKYSDIAELNWVLFEYAESKVEEGMITIHLPAGTSTSNDYYLFTDVLPNATSTINDDSIIIEFSDLKSSDIVEFRLLMPNQLFPNIASKNTYINDGINLQVILDFQEQQARNRQLNMIMNYVIISAGIIQFFIFIVQFAKLKKKWLDPHKVNVENTYNTDPPNDYPAAIINRMFTFNRPSMKDVTLTLLDLVERGYVTVDDSHLFNEYDPFDMEIMLQKEALEDQNLSEDVRYDEQFDHARYTKAEDNFYIVFVLNKEKSIDELLEYEKTLIEWFFVHIGDEGRVTTKQINEYRSTKSIDAIKSSNFAMKFVSQLTIEAEEKKFIEDSKESQNNMYIVLLIPLLTLLFSLLTLLFSSSPAVTYVSFLLVFQMIVFGIYITGKRRRTYAAEEIYQRYQTYKKQLSSMEHIKTLNINDAEYMDHLLVYSVLFDLNEDILSEMENLILDNNNTDSTEQDKSNQNDYLKRRYYHRLYRHHIHQVYINSSRFFYLSSSSSSRSSSGGYRGGGGSFGGGGGGGRSR